MSTCTCKPTNHRLHVQSGVRFGLACANSKIMGQYNFCNRRSVTTLARAALHVLLIRCIFSLAPAPSDADVRPFGRSRINASETADWGSRKAPHRTPTDHPSQTPRKSLTVRPRTTTTPQPHRSTRVLISVRAGAILRDLSARYKALDSHRRFGIGSRRYQREPRGMSRIVKLW
jgi:hypothetical protein